jgi:PAS domain S-box-containing protein
MLPVFRYIVDNNSYYLDNPFLGEIPSQNSPEPAVRCDGIEFSGLNMELDYRDMNSHDFDARTELDQFVTGTVYLALSVSCAESAVLLMRREPDWFIRASADTSNGREGVLLDEPFDPATGNAGDVPVPRSVFDHCLRYDESLVLADAGTDDRCAGDRTVKAREIRSLACIPISSRGEVKAILYLESREAADVFTPVRVEMLERLCSQLSLCIQNTMLSEELSGKVREYQKIKESFDLATDASAAGIWDWDVSSDRIHFSGRIGEMLGYPPEELPDSLDEFWDLIHPDDLQDARLAFEKHLKERVPYLMDLRLRTRSGEYQWLHSRGQASWDDNGNAVRMAGSLADVADRKNTELRLARSEERFRHMMDQSPLAMEILSPEGRIIRYNKAWLKLWGIVKEEAAKVLVTYNMITDPQVREHGILPLVERAFSGETVILPPIQYRGEKLAEDLNVELSGPNTNWIQCYLFSIKDEDGKIVNVINTYMDITALKLVEQEARENREALARVDRASSMGQLTGSISHELNQPLTGILSNAQAAELLLAREDLDRDELVDIISTIISDTKRAGEVIRNLREVYREQKGDFTPLDLSKIIVGTIDLMHSEFIMQDIAISHEYAASVPEVRGNRIQIQQVLVNILMNAMQAMSSHEKQDRQIHVETILEGNEIKVLVEDNGPGIDPDNIDRIFEPLATWKPGGTGMGLAISNAIIKAHGGRMISENRSEGGARVGFVIPLTKEEKTK